MFMPVFSTLSDKIHLYSPINYVKMSQCKKTFTFALYNTVNTENRPIHFLHYISFFIVCGLLTVSLIVYIHGNLLHCFFLVFSGTSGRN